MITTALRRSIWYFEEYRERIRCGDLCHLYLNQTIGMEIFFNNVEHQTDFLYLYYKNIWFYVFILSFFSQIICKPNLKMILSTHHTWSKA